MKTNHHDRTPILYMMIGAPGSGKSTYIKQFKQMREKIKSREFVILSTDEYIEAKAQEEGKLYGEVFSRYIDAAEKNLNERLEHAIKNNLDIVWDQTNMSAKNRAKKLAKVPKHYYTLGYVFHVEREELNRRLDARSKETGKFIPQHIVDSMLENYEAPTEDEFDEFRYITPLGGKSED